MTTWSILNKYHRYKHCQSQIWAWIFLKINVLFDLIKIHIVRHAALPDRCIMNTELGVGLWSNEEQTLFWITSQFSRSKVKGAQERKKFRFFVVWLMFQPIHQTFVSRNSLNFAFLALISSRNSIFSYISCKYSELSVCFFTYAYKKIWRNWSHCLIDSLLNTTWFAHHSFFFVPRVIRGRHWPVLVWVYLSSECYLSSLCYCILAQGKRHSKLGMSPEQSIDRK